MLSKREKIIFFFTISIIVFSLMLNFVFLPVINKFQALSQEITSCQLNLKKSFRLLARKQRIQQDYDKISSIVQSETGEEEIIGSVLAQLENLSSRSGLRIVDVRPQTSRNLGRYKEIVVELKQEGKIDGFLKFIYDLENPPYLLRIKKLQLNSKATEGILEGRLLVSKIYLVSEEP